MTKKGIRLYQLPEKIMHIFAWISAGVVMFNFVLLCANVFMRYVCNSPIKGTSEIVTMMMAWVAYMGMAYTMLNGKHMQLEAIYEKLHGRSKHVFNLFIYLIATILFVIFAKASFDVFWQSWLIKEESVASVTVYVFIGKFGTFLGWVLLFIQTLLMTIYCVLGIMNPEKFAPIGVYSEIPTEEEVAGFVKNESNEVEKGGEKL